MPVPPAAPRARAGVKGESPRPNRVVDPTAAGPHIVDPMLGVVAMPVEHDLPHAEDADLFLNPQTYHDHINSDVYLKIDGLDSEKRVRRKTPDPFALKEDADPFLAPEPFHATAYADDATVADEKREKTKQGPPKLISESVSL